MKICDACKRSIYEPSGRHVLTFNLLEWNICCYCWWKVCSLLQLKVGDKDK